MGTAAGSWWPLRALAAALRPDFRRSSAARDAWAFSTSANESSCSLRNSRTRYKLRYVKPGCFKLHCIKLRDFRAFGLACDCGLVDVFLTPCTSLPQFLGFDTSKPEQLSMLRLCDIQTGVPCTLS